MTVRSSSLLLSSWLLLGASPDAGRQPPASAPDPVALSGTASRVHATVPCRGGAAILPSEFEHESQPLVQQVLTVSVGEVPGGKVVARPKTDRAGGFALSLAPGVYCVVVGEPRPSPPEEEPARPVASGAGPHLDPACLAELAHPTPRCDARWIVGKGSPTKVSVSLYSSNTCPQPWAHPCWRGPMPPSAPARP